MGDDYIAEWYPFTVDEISVAFEAMAMGPSEARSAAEGLAEDIRNADFESGFGLVEVGDFLGPIAALSSEHRTRVERFREARGQPNPGLFADDEEWPHGSGA